MSINQYEFIKGIGNFPNIKILNFKQSHETFYGISIEGKKDGWF
jgi:hypothetical protein